MKPLLSISILWMVIGAAHVLCQSNTDSLLANISNEPIDTKAVRSYLDLHRTYLNSDSIQAEAFLEKAIQTSRELDASNWLAMSELQHANFAWKIGDLSRANTALAVVDSVLRRREDPKIRSTFHLESGILNYMSGTYDTAVYHFLIAKKGFEALGDSTGAMKCHTNTGMVHWAMGDYQQALPYYQDGLSFAEKNKDSLSIAQMNGNIGLIYRARGQLETALTYYRRSLEINRIKGQKLDAGINLLNMASAYSELRNYSEARKHYQASLDMARLVNDQIGVLYAIHGLGNLYQQQGLCRQAIPRLQEALALAQKLQASAETKNIYEDLAECYEKEGKLAQALESRKNLAFWKDSLTGESHRNRVKELEIAYETEKNRKKIALLTRDRELEKLRADKQTFWIRVLAAGLFSILVITGLTIYLLRQRVRHEKVIAAKNEEIQKSHFHQRMSELKLKALQAQMNPHFVFNCLNSINLMVLKGETDQASRYLAKFSRLMRSVLEHSEIGLIPLYDEIQLLKNYLALESLRFKDSFQSHLDIAPEVDTKEILVPSLILQPLVENAIWHGLMPRRKKGEIRISVGLEGNVLKLQVEDNGLGIGDTPLLPESVSGEKTSFGLRLLKERLTILNQNDLAPSLEVLDLKTVAPGRSGTRAIIRIPLQPLEADNQKNRTDQIS